MKVAALGVGATAAGCWAVGVLPEHRRAGIGVAVVSADRAHAVDVLDAAERMVAARPEIELLSARRAVAHSED